MECLNDVRDGFASGEAPTLTEEGTSGAYILKAEMDSHTEASRPVAIWKPIDEEPFAPNNPRGMQAPFGSETCRPGVKSGESSLREVLAYLLDHDGFAGVPPTALIELSHSSLEMNPVSETEVANDEFRNLISGLLSFKKAKQHSNITPNRSPDSSPKSASTKSSPSVTDAEQLLTDQNTPQKKLGSL